MGTEVYWFSGTGNSLAVARTVAEKTGATLISIQSVMDRPSIMTGADSIGIVFPSYLALLDGVPLIVGRFVDKLEDIGKKYIFAVCTCGGFEAVNALPTLKNLGRSIRKKGGRLTGEFSVRLPMNNLDPYFYQEKNRASMFEACDAKLGRICARIARKKPVENRAVGTLVNFLLTPMHRMLRGFFVTDLKKKAQESEDTPLSYKELILLTDRSIVIGEACNGCGTCAKVCPSENISMVKGKPVHLHRCEMCLACDEWCPRRAVRHWCKTPGLDYHHPAVRLEDML